jgi:hypothetical protein
VLEGPLLAVFCRMPPEDRRHGLAMLEAVRATGTTDPPLLEAALLHDCGKAEAGVGLVARIARVVLRSLAPALWRWLSDTPTGWKRPYWVLANHPERGAVWLASSGASQETCELVRYHEAAPPPHWAGRTELLRWHATLSAEDAKR